MSKKTTDKLIKAFARDGYQVDTVKKFQNKRGILAKSIGTQNYETGEPKTVLYICRLKKVSLFISQPPGPISVVQWPLNFYSS